MRVRNLTLALVMGTVMIASLTAQVRPGDADNGTVRDVLGDHDSVSATYELFGSEFEDVLGGEDNVALFAPTDEVLGDIIDASLDS